MFNPFSIFKHQRKLHIDIVLAFVTFFVIACFTLIAYYYETQSKAQLGFARQLIVQTEKYVIDNIEDYIRPNALTDMMANLLENNDLNLESDDSISDFMETILKAYPEVLSFRVASLDGTYVQEIRVSALKNKQFSDESIIPSNVAYITQMLRRNKTGALETRQFLKSKHDELISSGSAKHLIHYDAPHRPWYLGASQHLKSFWVDLNYSTTLKQVVITVAYPIVNSANKIIGVTAADLSPDAISKFLKKQHLTKNSQLFIANQFGQLIATPNLEELYATKNDPKKDLATISDFKSPYVKRAFSQFLATNNSHLLFNFNHTKYIAEFEKFSQDLGEDWVVGIVLPVDDYIGKLKRQNRLTVIYSLGLLFIGMIAIFFIARSISKPIVKLTHAMSRIKLFQLDDPILIRSHISEVEMMVNALQMMKASLKSFARYVPTELVRTLIETGDVAKLGMEKKNIALLFSDIVGFTEIVEHLPAEQLSEQLTEYLECITQIIKHHFGTIDKYIGDAVMAMWGAPLSDEQPALNACYAALYARSRINELNEEWKLQGKPSFQTRFGLNYGETQVGNIGSSDRINYTAIGDNVNLAARLEGINKIYNTQIIISHNVYLAVKDHFLVRPIDEVIVKGKSTSTLIYELVASKHVPALATTPQEQELCELTLHAFTAYYHQEWSVALQRYHYILEKHPGDRVAQIFIERCLAVVRKNT